MSCGQTPCRRHDEPHRTRWRPIEQTARRLPRGFLWPRGDRGTPRYLMKPPSRGAWRCKRGRGRSLPLAVRTKRNAGNRSAPKPCSRPLSDNRHAAAAALDGKRKGVIGHSRSTCCGSDRLAQRGADRPLQLTHPTAPGPRDAAPGRGRPCFGFGSSSRLARLVGRIEGVLSFPGPPTVADARFTSPGSAHTSRARICDTTTERTRARASTAAGDRRRGCGQGSATAPYRSAPTGGLLHDIAGGGIRTWWPSPASRRSPSGRTWRARSRSLMGLQSLHVDPVVHAIIIHRSRVVHRRTARQQQKLPGGPQSVGRTHRHPAGNRRRSRTPSSTSEPIARVIGWRSILDPSDSYDTDTPRHLLQIDSSFLAL